MPVKCNTINDHSIRDVIAPVAVHQVSSSRRISATISEQCDVMCSIHRSAAEKNGKNSIFSNPSRSNSHLFGDEKAKLPAAK